MDSDTAAAEWQAAAHRVRDLVRDAGTDALDQHVPATPAWRVRDLLAHMIGLDADTLAGDEPDDHNPEWTQAQVDKRRDTDVDGLLAEWRALEDDLVAYIRETSPRPLGDVIIHEQDLRGALGSPGARDTAGLAAIRDQLADRLGGAVGKAGLRPLVLESDDWTWRSGDGEPGVVLRASAYDLFRAITSRRTEAQLRSYVVGGDVGPYLETLSAMGDLPDSPLPE